MALGKIKADTLEHSTAGSLGTEFFVNGSSKHWISVTYNSGTPTNRDSLNVSSIADTAAGECTVTLSTAFNAATDYCWVSGTLNTSASQEQITCYTKAASNYKTYNYNSGGAGGIDPEGFYVVSIGDLA